MRATRYPCLTAALLTWVAGCDDQGMAAGSTPGAVVLPAQVETEPRNTSPSTTPPPPGAAEPVESADPVSPSPMTSASNGMAGGAGPGEVVDAGIATDAADAGEGLATDTRCPEGNQPPDGECAPGSGSAPELCSYGDTRCVCQAGQQSARWVCGACPEAVVDGAECTVTGLTCGDCSCESSWLPGGQRAWSFVCPMP